MQFTTKLRSQKAFVLEANATGMNTAKIQQFVFVFLVFAFFFFLNLEKQRGVQNAIEKPTVFEITDQIHILECIREFYESLFKKRKQKTATDIKSFLSYINIPKLSEYKQNF